MGTKLNPGAYDCYDNALPDEPMFVLLARDPLAPEIVMEWAMRFFETSTAHSTANTRDEEKFREAIACAIAMKSWRLANPKPEGGYPKPVSASVSPKDTLTASGFTLGDFSELVARLRDRPDNADAIMSNNFNVILAALDIAANHADAATVRDYEDARDSFLVHVHDLDVAMNGVDGAAERPLIIDIKAQLMAYIGLGNCAALAVERYEKALANREHGGAAAHEFVQMVMAEVKANHGHITAPVEMGK